MIVLPPLVLQGHTTRESITLSQSKLILIRELSINMMISDHFPPSVSETYEELQNHVDVMKRSALSREQYQDRAATKLLVNSCNKLQL